ncbi:MAG: hypothetical protein ACFFDN_04490 [Candidatus Hodarchaeota archaeon]
MNKKGAILFLIILFLIILSFACKKEPERAVEFQKETWVEPEIDIRKINTLTGVEFKILKTQTIGYIPLHKFYWVCLKEKENMQKIRKLADALIKETITQKTRTYHSFTVHFFCERELAKTPEKSKSLARANFLPEGKWSRVGVEPIEEYKNYKLTCELLD